MHSMNDREAAAFHKAGTRIGFGGTNESWTRPAPGWVGRATSETSDLRPGRFLTCRAWTHSEPAERHRVECVRALLAEAPIDGRVSAASRQPNRQEAMRLMRKWRDARLARSLPDARAIADELTARQISLSLAGSVYDPNDAVGRLLFNILAMVAEFESDLIGLRTREGMKVAKAKRRLRGKQPKLNRRQEAHLVSLVHSGEYSTAEVAELFGVGRSTVYRAIERQRIEARAGLAKSTSRV
jgi:DNA invertase Pin-like site-specific DNA recombinase